MFFGLISFKSNYARPFYLLEFLSFCLTYFHFHLAACRNYQKWSSPIFQWDPPQLYSYTTLAKPWSLCSRYHKKAESLRNYPFTVLNIRFPLIIQALYYPALLFSSYTLLVKTVVFFVFLQDFALYCLSIFIRPFSPNLTFLYQYF